MRPKVVVAEKIAEAGISHLREHCEVEVVVDAPRKALLAALKDAQGLVVRSGTAVDAELIGAAPSLQVVGRAGIGVDNIDLEAATAAGVLVVNAPTANAVSAAEHTMALLLAQARRVPEADASLRAGSWDRKHLQGVELHGKVLGVVGLGRIGTLVAQRASAFGMRILGFDPYVSEDRARRLGVELHPELSYLLAEADFITIHLPLTRDTEGIIDAKALSGAKPGIRIVNASRGGIVNEEDLAEAVRSGVVAGAALDVFAVEPLTDSPLFDLPQVVLTPHLGASTVEAQDKAGTDVAAAVADALRGELVTTAVNIDLGRDVPDQLLPFLPVAERLGAVFVALAQGLPNDLTVRAEGLLGELPSRPLALAALKGALSQVSDQPVSYVNAPTIAASHGVKVIEQTSGDIGDFSALIRVSGEVGGVETAVAGSIVGRRGPVIVEILDHAFELPFSDAMLVLLNDDVPGVIGRVGTFLGGIGVNISDMVVGRSPATGEAAMMGLNLERRLDEGELAAIGALDGVARAWFVDLA